MSKVFLNIGKYDGGAFTLPLEAVTQTFAVIAKRGVGKTHTVVVMTEEMLSAGLQVVVIDPLDVWWGIRSAPDGKGEGFAVPVIGGQHADVPLKATDGAIIADFIVEQRAPAVLSLRHLNNSEQRQFVTAFCLQLYHRKGEAQHQTPLHLVIDEADAYAPQRLFPDVQRCFGAVDAIVRRGRSSGMGVTLISQRSAAINKDVLTQAEVMVALRTISPQDQAAIEAWIEAHDAEDKHDEFMDSLASLPVGTAWFWSPGWLEIFTKVQVRKRSTFDSSATPKVGAKPIHATLAQIDLGQLNAKLAATIEHAKAEDPRELKKKIAELQRELSKRSVTMAKSPQEIEAQRIAIAAAGETGFAKGLRAIGEFITNTLNHPDYKTGSAQRGRIQPQELKSGTRGIVPAAGAIPASPASSSTSADLSRCERAILSVLAQYPQGRSKIQIAVIAGYAHNSGGFNNSLSRLRSAEFIDRADPIRITPAGLQALGPFEPLPTGLALYEYWLKKLSRCEAQILRVLVTRGGEMSKHEIAAAANYAPDSGGFNNSLSRLRTLELIQGGQRAIAANEILFQ